MLSKEEKEAIETLEIEGTENNYLEVKILLNLVDKQQKEIAEKTTIIMAGAEKVKQLEKEIEELKEKNKNLIFQLKDEEKELIEVTDKIREKINYYRKYCGYDGVTMIGNTQLKELEELLEENDE